MTIVENFQNCREEKLLEYRLVRRCQRSQQLVIAANNTETLEECMALARSVHGLALNYASFLRRSRTNSFAVENSDEALSFNNRIAKRRQGLWKQPEEFFNCLVLQCPENASFFTMTNDSRFDYFSLYGRPIESTNYTCSPGVGLFTLFTTPETYETAVKTCSRLEGGNAALAHVISAKRTKAISNILRVYSYDQKQLSMDGASKLLKTYS
ncbi:uncharacterized protein LOC119676966 [Teleopsis dalmanni]|uniref:uncharacterized protein LOC119676966 n=1 Tax=Teleopsis dalmanni TaxID=139649 RepID=UPI0018CCA43D|nr:uncharacterized protein LOC119676966 [Teleopsis dalmanni]